MRNIPLYDCRMMLGRGKSPEYSFQGSTGDSIKLALGKYGIEKALVSYASATLWFDYNYANKLVFDLARNDLRLIPCR